MMYNVNKDVNVGRQKLHPILIADIYIWKYTTLKHVSMKMSDLPRKFCKTAYKLPFLYIFLTDQADCHTVNML